MQQTRQLICDLFDSKTIQDLVDESCGEHVMMFEI